MKLCPAGWCQLVNESAHNGERKLVPQRILSLRLLASHEFQGKQTGSCSIPPLPLSWSYSRSSHPAPRKTGTCVSLYTHGPTGTTQPPHIVQAPLQGLHSKYPSLPGRCPAQASLDCKAEADIEFAGASGLSLRGSLWESTRGSCNPCKPSPWSGSQSILGCDPK